MSFKTGDYIEVDGRILEVESLCDNGQWVNVPKEEYEDGCLCAIHIEDCKPSTRKAYLMQCIDDMQNEIDEITKLDPVTIETRGKVVKGDGKECRVTTLNNMWNLIHFYINNEGAHMFSDFEKFIGHEVKLTVTLEGVKGDENEGRRWADR